MLDDVRKLNQLVEGRERFEILLAAVTSSAMQANSLHERRQAVLKLLLELVGADVGHWAWGFGDVVSNGVLPVAILVEGYSEEQLAGFKQMSLDTERMRPFHMRIYELMGGNHHSTVIRRDIFADHEWMASKMRTSLNKMGIDEWLHCVRYQSPNVWSNMFFVRNCNVGSFDAEDAALLDIAMKSISWLHSTSEECVPKDMLVGLTDRQRLITFMVLDGTPRKLVAAKLHISEDTVGDHMKNIFKHFDVNSATELAAIFLKSK